MADLYHFATKEGSYANYFIHVSPRPSSSPLKLGVDARGRGRWDPYMKWDVCSVGSGEGSASLDSPDVSLCPHSSWRSRLITIAGH